MTNYREAITDSLLMAMKDDPSVICLGVGVTDEKGIFGTTKAAHELFPGRVLETPLSENALTGALAGLSLTGFKPVLVHARADFLMLTMEHLVNTLAKWRLMHNHKASMPIVIRALIGRGWGQGAQHSQSFAGMLSQVPGITVIVPVYATNARYSLQYALESEGLTIILESRRLFETNLYPDYIIAPDVNLVTFGDIVLDALDAQRILKSMDIRASVIPVEDITSLRLTNWFTQNDLAEPPAVICDTGHLFCGVSAEMYAKLVENHNDQVVRVGPPFLPCPTSTALESRWYPTPADIVAATCKLLHVQVPTKMSAMGYTRDGRKEPF